MVTAIISFQREATHLAQQRVINENNYAEETQESDFYVAFVSRDNERRTHF